VYQADYNEYDLLLQNDINTKGHCQWFFFMVRHVPKDVTLKLNIVNLTKRGIFSDDAMKPFVFSTVRYQKRKIGWAREGLKVTYRENTRFKRESSSKPYFAFSFDYKFIYA
jgi:hypothetical protein